MNYKDFNEKRSRLIENVKSLDNENLGEESRACIKKCADKLETGKFQISVFGTFSTGKSTLLNALMQFKEEILKVDELACTAAVTTLQAPPTPELNNKAEIIFNDESVKNKIIPITQIQDYSAKRRTGGDITDTSVEDEVKEVRVYIDSPLLQNGVQIVDTPGLNSTYTKHTEITMDYLKKSDASLFLFSVEQAGTKEEFKFIDLLSENLNKAFLVLNQIDRKFNEFDSDVAIDNLCDDLKNKLELQGVTIGEKKIWPISAKYAFKAYCCTEPREQQKKLEESRFQDLINSIEIYLTGPEFVRDKLFVPVQKLENDLNGILERNDKLIQNIKVSNEELDEKIAEQKKRIDNEKKHINEVANNLQRLIIQEFSGCKANIKEKMTDISSDIIKDIESKATAYRMKRFLDQGGFADTLHSELEKHWNNIAETFSERVIDLCLQTANPDEESEIKIVNWVRQVTKNTMSFEVVSGIDSFKIDFSEAEELQRKLDKIDKALIQNADDLADCRRKTEIRTDLLSQRDNLEAEKRHLKSSIDLLYAEKAKVRDEIVEEDVYTKKKRGGWLGWLIDKTVGEKTLHIKERREQTEEGDKQRQNYQDEIDRINGEKGAVEDNLGNVKEQISELSGIEARREEFELERTKLYSAFSDLESQIQKSKDDAEREQISDLQKKLRIEIKGIIEKFLKTAIRRLDEICRNYKKISPRVAELGSSEISSLKKEYEELYAIKADSSDEREKTLAAKENENKMLNLALNSVKDILHY